MMTEALLLMKRNIIRFAAFALTGFLLLQAASFFFRGSYWFSRGFIYDRTARLAAFDTETPGQIDVLNLGDSLSICALSPLELFRDYGITSYNLGQDMQFPVESYYALKHALKTQPIKVVLLETNAIFYENSLADEGVKTLSESLQSLFPFLRYHNLWKIPFMKKSIRSYFKGYTINEIERPFTYDKEYDFNNTTVYYPIARQQLFQLKRIQKLCEDYGITLILYSSASIMNYYTMRKHNTLIDICRENGIHFIDANYDIASVNVNWETDTWDNGDHLNLSGCRKMTAYLGDRLRATVNDLPDHRSDPLYVSWTEMYQDYLAEVEKMEGKNYSMIENELRH